MPLHSVQRLSPTAVLGLWHLTETPEALWAGLPNAATYQPLLPARADARREAQWLAGRRLAHALFGELPTPLPPETLVQNDATGRPWLLGAPADTVVSLSHSGEWAAAVLAQGGRAGVDIELIRDKAQRLAGKFLAENEWNHARAATADIAPDAHYSLLWSAKEALYKLAAQRGIIFRQQLLLHEFSPATSGEIPATLVLGGAETRHRICYTQPAPGYVLTYCHESAG
ncbi:4'-phosphopantetheinyl transferase superfamily protein [Hymenobacter sp. DH14]|uniref:4'-phosphopantetheinyl transferase superfamily protein n=1 Tax=Hymenobacter cyanobacteriorum TaxID=2926463 RepID=A0A9X2AJM3_9BACT|nr:4'-phosphopantetheinyl transferase superfamily protein [Hymenobacter cyanobacteriorum]MCI1188994.1 4'-phosphopantetheinyl transferase superfamily protein [Hymenobacter cyanobacteriorum]